MAYSLPGALAGGGPDRPDILVAYPTADRSALAELAADPQGRGGGHADGGLPRAPRPGPPGRRAPARCRCVHCIDASSAALGGQVRAGAALPGRTPADAAQRGGGHHQAARAAARQADGYEGQIAGVGDSPQDGAARPGDPGYQRQSAAELARRRAASPPVREVAPVSSSTAAGPAGAPDRGRVARDRDRRRVRAVRQPACSTATGRSPGSTALFAVPVVRHVRARGGHRGVRRLPRVRARPTRPAAAAAPANRAAAELERRAPRGADAAIGRPRTGWRSAAGPTCGTPRRASCAAVHPAAPGGGHRVTGPCPPTGARGSRSAEPRCAALRRRARGTPQPTRQSRLARR